VLDVESDDTGEGVVGPVQFETPVVLPVVLCIEGEVDGVALWMQR